MWVIKSGHASCIRSGVVGAKILVKKLLVVKSIWKLRLVSFFVYVFMVPLSILHFKVDCVWFLSKVSAPISIQFILEMPQVVCIMPLRFYGFRLILGLSKR